MQHVLVTGGAGFIGSHLVDRLIERGDRVRVLDNLDAQVHGAIDRPSYLHRDAELVVADVRDREAVDRALDDIDAVCHLAAVVGVGQSMYEIERYTSVNCCGTATLLQALTERRVTRLVVASSMSVYGEGENAYEDGSEAPPPFERTIDQMRRGTWDIHDPSGVPLIARPTRETKPVSLQSVYAVSKFVQEQLAITVGAAYGIPTIALRFFNVFGTRQALSNPYTGVLAIFASRLLNDQPPLIYEDGEQLRDFVSVHDVVQALEQSIDAPPHVSGIFNIGSGVAWTVKQVAETLADTLGRRDVGTEITGRFRAGDVRHCFADVSRARDVLGYRPRVDLVSGLFDLTAWLVTQRAEDRLPSADRELMARGLSA